MRSLVFLLQLAVLSLGLTPFARAEDANTAYIVTYIETSPAAKAKALAMLKEVAKASRKEEGNLRFDALQQSSRPNHMTVTEIWSDMATYGAHGMTAPTRAFRDKLLPRAAASTTSACTGASIRGG